jgi:hypothetical protein
MLKIAHVLQHTFEKFFYTFFFSLVHKKVCFRIAAFSCFHQLIPPDFLSRFKTGEYVANALGLFAISIQFSFSEVFFLQNSSMQLNRNA